MSSQFINTTGGKAVYCGSMEYRNAKSGFFQFQTIVEMKCKYTISFTSVEIEGMKIISCNLVKNNISKVDGEDAKSNPPALIFVIKNNVSIENFYFKDNEYNDNGKFIYIYD